MKNTFKYLLLLCASAFGFASCQEEVADVQGVVGDFAYIVDGTEAMYKSTTCYVYHTTTLGEVGEVATQVTVALTEKQASAVDIVVDVDNTSLTGDYNAFPEGVLKFNGKVTIPAGQKEATIDVKIDKADFPKLTEVLYQAPFRIASASGVKVSTNSNIAYLMVVTENVDPIANLLSVEESVTEFGIKNYPNETTITGAEAISKTITINGVDPAFQAFNVTLSVDNSLVAKYNAANGTDYQTLPSGVKVNFTDPITMAQDAKATTATITVENISNIVAGENQAYLTDERGYLVPVVLGVNPDEATIDENCGVTYIVIKPTNFETASNFFSALYLGDYRMATWYKFEKPMVFQPSPDGNQGYTYIFHVYLDEITRVARIGNFSDANEGWINMLRYGQKGNYDTRLEWWVGPGKLRKHLYAPAIEAGRWYQYALVYNQNSYIMYLDCEEVARVDLTADEKAVLTAERCEFQAIEFNSSWGTGYRRGNELHGRISNVVVWNYGLGKNRITQCYGGVDNDRATNMYNSDWGAWWKFDEGAGHVIKQAGGRPFGDIDFSNTTRCDDEVNYVYNVDVSPYLQWKQDEHNEWPYEVKYQNGQFNKAYLELKQN